LAFRQHQDPDTGKLKACIAVTILCQANFDLLKALFRNLYLLLFCLSLTHKLKYTQKRTDALATHKQTNKNYGQPNNAESAGPFSAGTKSPLHIQLPLGHKLLHNVLIPKLAR
jgi:hypothetical protein